MEDQYGDRDIRGGNAARERERERERERSQEYDDDDDDGDVVTPNKLTDARSPQHGAMEDQNQSGAQSSGGKRFYASLIRNIFDHFDSRNEGRLYEDDIEEMFSVAKEQFDRQLFETPIDFDQFQDIWERMSPKSAERLIKYLQEHQQTQVLTFVFFFFFLNTTK